MLGGFIDCDNDKDGNSGDNNGNSACSRWMMWAAVSLVFSTASPFIIYSTLSCGTHEMFN